MNQKYKQTDLWIGIAKVKQNARNGVLGNVDQAYTNVIGLAKNKPDFRSQVKQSVEALKLQLLRLEEAEPLKIHLTKFTMHEELSALVKEVEEKGGKKSGVRPAIRFCAKVERKIWRKI